MIEKFRKEYFFLSNMKSLDNWIETDQGFLVPTAEHAYQAAKFQDRTIHQHIAWARGNQDDTRMHADGVASKELAYNLAESGVKIRSDWEVAKLGIMRVVIQQKFKKNQDLARMLVATAPEEIVEGNDWGDRFWGVDPIGSKNGDNHLGRILMQTRDELIPETDLHEDQY